MHINTITFFSGDMERTMRGVLNALPTPEGRRFCQPTRFQKNRVYAEAWLELRDKWLRFLNKKVHKEIDADCLPYCDGKGDGPYRDAFKFTTMGGMDIYISVAPSAAAAIIGFHRHNYRAWNKIHLWAYWDDVKEDFVIIKGF